MQILQGFSSILNKKSTFYFLVSTTIIITVLSFIINKDVISGDQYTYMYYVKGLQVDRYSYWYFLKDYIPDTFRNPGYPIFIYILSFISDSIYFVKIVQLFIFFITLFLMIKLIEKQEDSLVLKNLFLILVNINFVVLSYSAFVFPEVLVMFLITLIVYIELYFSNNNWVKVLILALLYAYCFQVRPVILFLPFFRFLYYLYKHKNLSIIKNLTFIVIFIATLLPYGFWNLKHHKQFKITPIEGGAGAMYLGYWCPKMINHLEDKLWRNVMYKDVLINFEKLENVPHNIVLFNNEIDSVNNICSRFNSKIDSANLILMKKNPDLFVTFNTKYTAERERILKSLAISHYLQDWQYSLKLKTFTFFRLWYTGWSIDDAKEHKKSLVSQTPIILAFITTFTTLLIFIFYFLFCLCKRRDILISIIFPLLLCFYFTIFHLPFVIQSRYTIPVRLLYLFSLSFMIYKIHFTKKTKHESH